MSNTSTNTPAETHGASLHSEAPVVVAQLRPETFPLPGVQIDQMFRDQTHTELPLTPGAESVRNMQVAQRAAARGTAITDLRENTALWKLAAKGDYTYAA